MDIDPFGYEERKSGPPPLNIIHEDEEVETPVSNCTPGLINVMGVNYVDNLLSEALDYGGTTSTAKSEIVQHKILDKDVLNVTEIPIPTWTMFTFHGFGNTQFLYRRGSSSRVIFAAFFSTVQVNVGGENVTRCTFPYGALSSTIDLVDQLGYITRCSDKNAAGNIALSLEFNQNCVHVLFRFNRVKDPVCSPHGRYVGGGGREEYTVNNQMLYFWPEIDTGDSRKCLMWKCASEEAYIS